MSKKIIKMVSILLIGCLVLGVGSSFVLAAEKDLTPYEWTRLSADEKIEYKTIKIRAGRSDEFLEEKEYKGPRDEGFDRLVDTGDMYVALSIYSRSLFHTLYPDIEVIGVPMNIEDPSVIVPALAAGTAPCFYFVSGVGGLRPAIREGLLADITDLVKNWGEIGIYDQYTHLKETFWPVWKFGWKDDHCYALPHGTRHAWGMWFRRDWFKEAGVFDRQGKPGPNDDWTWNDLREISKKLTDVKKKRWGLVYSPEGAPDVEILYDIACSFGSLIPSIFIVPDPSGENTWKFGDTPPLRKALEYLHQLSFEDKSLLVSFVGAGAGRGAAAPRKEFMSSRAAIYYDWHPRGHLAGRPWTFSDKIKATEIAGSTYLPQGPYGQRRNSLMCSWIGFDPTLDKEHLEAAFRWWDWRKTKDMEIKARADVDNYTLGIIPRNIAVGNITWGLGTGGFFAYELNWPEGLPKMSEIYPADYMEHYEGTLRLPAGPEPFEYGLLENKLEIGAELGAALKSLMEAAVIDPNFDIEAEMVRAGNLASKAYNYKIKGDKEKLEVYFNALEEFYKKNYPEFYESDLFKGQWEKYYKIW